MRERRNPKKKEERDDILIIQYLSGETDAIQTVKEFDGDPYKESGMLQMQKLVIITRELGLWNFGEQSGLRVRMPAC